MKLIDQQRELMKKALALRRDMDLIYKVFGYRTKEFCDERSKEIRAEYAATMTELVRITTEAIQHEQQQH